MSAGSFHMALFESATARRERRRSENHANGRVLMAGALDRITGHDTNPNFTDHSDVRRCGCGSARDAVGHGAARPGTGRVPPRPRGCRVGHHPPLKRTNPPSCSSTGLCKQLERSCRAARA